MKEVVVLYAITAFWEGSGFNVAILFVEEQDTITNEIIEAKKVKIFLILVFKINFDDNVTKLHN